MAFANTNMQYKGILHINGEKFVITRENTKVGSLGSCHISLVHPSISKIHIRIDWTKVGLVITNMTAVGKTFLNDVALKPLEGKAIKKSETTLKLGDLEGRLILHKHAKRIARTSAKEVQQMSRKLRCSNCRKGRDIKIRGKFDEKRKFHLKFEIPKKPKRIGKKDKSDLRREAIDRSLYLNFSNLSLVFPKN